jgi:hypothetical protein
MERGTPTHLSPVQPAMAIIFELHCHESVQIEATSWQLEVLIKSVALRGKKGIDSE